MRITRTMTRAISRFLIGAVLFAQFAVAGYACPGLMRTAAMAAGESEMTMDMSMTAMESLETSSTATTAAMPPGCDQIDPDAANLCAEHCHQGQQSADTTAVPLVSLGVPTFLYSLPLEPQHSLGSGRSFPAPDARLDAAPEPPHAILHCVFRI